MEVKYYTPSIEEFYVGFEYERVVKWAVTKLGNTIIFHHELDVYSTFNFTFKDLEVTSYLGNQIEYYTLNEFVKSGVRVKYLDKEDIESLGWKIEKVDKLRYKLDFTKVFSKNNWIIVYYTFESVLPNKLIIYNNTYTDCIFKGTIKNKSELIKLLKQLKINED